MVRALKDVQVILTILCGLALAASAFPPTRGAAYAGVAFGSYFAVKAAIDSLRHRQLDVNFLMIFAGAGAVSIGRATDAAALLFLFSLSSTLEAYTMARTRSAIEGLIRLRPATALRFAGGIEERVPVESLAVGDTVRIPPFENVPIDGEVVEGTGSIDQSAMTGESVPIAVAPGSKVLAGTQNLDSALSVIVASRVGDSALDKIVELVRDAQENKASGERIGQWFGQRYTFFVMAAFVVSLLVRAMLGSTWFDAVALSLTLLVALSPCALVISTPATTLSALAWAARNGILVRGGEFIERAATIDTIALDKTGTLTSGKPELVEICVCDVRLAHAGHAIDGDSGVCLQEHACWSGTPEMSPEAMEALSLAAAAERHSSHPIAEAIVRAASDRGLDVPVATQQRVVSGLGVTAVVGSKDVAIGQRAFFEQGDESLDSDFARHVAAIQAEGMTVAILRSGDRLAALGLRDEPRPEVADFLTSVRASGVRHIVMVTGDTRQTAEAIAHELGISEFHAAMLPQDKAEFVQRETAAGSKLMMVGDGVNDAPSLAASTLGVAMGGLGSDVALNAADVVLMRDRLSAIPDLIALGRKTTRIVRANLLFASGMIVTLTVASFVTRLPLPLAVLGHEGSTVVVILNGIRLLRGPGLRPHNIASMA